MVENVSSYGKSKSKPKKKLTKSCNKDKKKKRTDMSANTPG